MEANAPMNAMMNETLNIGGALLVKLFGARGLEVDRFQRARQRRARHGHRPGDVGHVFFAIIGLLSAVGTALVYGIGGYLAIRRAFHRRHDRGLWRLPGQPVQRLAELTNAPVEFATSLVSFERVFEVIDLPAEIEDKPERRDA